MSKTHLVLFAGIGLACISGVALMTSSANPSSDHSNAIEPVQANPSPKPKLPESVTDDSETAVPRASGLTIHPYDIVKNPFRFRGQLVLLDLRSRPVLYNGTVIQYSGPIEPKFGARYGFMALKLNRMLADDEAIYDVMGAEGGTSEGQMLGQLAVLLPPGATELDLARQWEVEPRGTIDGTNGFGAAITVPLVRFWHYQGQSVEAAAPRMQPGLDKPNQAERPRDQETPPTQAGGIIGTFQPSTPE